MRAEAASGPAVGMGFRAEVADKIFQNLSHFDVLEVTVDHYFGGGPRTRTGIREVSRLLPVVAHGVGLSVGTALSPDAAYLDEVVRVLELIGAPWHSEHLAFTKIPGRDTAQLLPLPRTCAVAEVVVHNLAEVRKHLGVPLALENITYYFEYPQSEMNEQDFLELVCRESGSYVLLDLENLYLNSRNHGYDPNEFIARLSPGLVKGVHVAGGTAHGDLLIDSHDRPIPPEVLDLLGRLLSCQSPETIIVERDQDLEPFDLVLEDVRRIRETIVHCTSRELHNDSGEAAGASDRAARLPD